MGFSLAPVRATVSSPQPTSRPLWQAEQIGTVFEATRVRRISRAQDALSPAEERVYNLLWGPRNLDRDEFRLSHYSLQRIAVDASLNIKTVRELLPRLIQKGFLDLEQEADPRRNQATLYRVWSYASVLVRQRAANRFYVVKTGKGIFYAHPVAATLTEQPEPMGLDIKPIGLTPMGYDSAPRGLGTAPMPAAPMAPMGSTGSRPMGSTGSLSKDIVLDSSYRQTTTTTEAYDQLVDLIRQGFAIDPDSVLLAGMIADCHQAAEETTGTPATDQELLQLAQDKIRVLARSPNIRNHLAVLRTALPKCFQGEAFRRLRQARQSSVRATAEPAGEFMTPEAEQEQRATEQRLARWTEISERHRTEQGSYDLLAIAADPELDEKGREAAQLQCRRLGRFSLSGL